MTAVEAAAHGRAPWRCAVAGRWLARPWNRDIPDAALRLVRGSSAFLEACTDHLIDLGALGVASPPCSTAGEASGSGPGSGRISRLDLYRCQLPRRRPASTAVVAPADAYGTGQPRSTGLPSSRHGGWRSSVARRLGLRPHRVFLVVGNNGRIDGFAIVGAELGASYLQRVAVDPAEQGRAWASRW